MQALSVALTYSEPQTLLSLGGSTLTKLPPISQPGHQPTLVASEVISVSPFSLAGLMTHCVNTIVAPITCSHIFSSAVSITSSAFTTQLLVIQWREKVPPILLHRRRS